jgi:hypothetical protein
MNTSKRNNSFPNISRKRIQRDYDTPNKLIEFESEREAQQFFELVDGKAPLLIKDEVICCDSEEYDTFYQPKRIKVEDTLIKEDPDVTKQKIS